MIRRGLSGLLSALILGVSVLGPLVDHAGDAVGIVVESRHDPAGCAPAHDHRACLQQQAFDPLFTPPGVTFARPFALRLHIGPAAASGPIATPRLDGHSARAPPRT
ncbi:MAG: hypothetical protein KJO11_10035 [Gemmatimonadetes bacterium]|nr:hypothetical protein [Gemmatimonadota bacterium]NNF38362.1 hypothetical protein [Gemmatimonadota bacterium]